MTESVRVWNVLFLCTGNSARSILAECVIDRLGGGRFRGYSAGSHPKGEIHPLALEILKRHRFPTAHLRSKDWSEFARPGAPEMDIIVTVCDNAAGEVCPIWPGRPASAHWGLPDPAAAKGTDSERRLAFEATLRALMQRIGKFVAPPLGSLDAAALNRRLERLSA